MFLLRYLYILALVIWLGGLIVAGAIVAPSVFAVLQASSPSDGRVLAGAVFGDVLRRVHLLGYALGGAMLVALTVQRVLGPRPVRYGVRTAIVGTMLGASLISGYVINPRVAAIARKVEGPIASLSDTDARRIEFYRLHGWSNLLLVSTALGGLVLLAWEARE